MLRPDLINYFIPFVFSLIIIMPSLVLNSDAESHNDTLIPLIGNVTVSDLPDNPVSNQTSSSFIVQDAESHMDTLIPLMGTVTVRNLPDNQVLNQIVVTPHLVQNPELYAEMKSQHRTLQTNETLSTMTFENALQMANIQTVSGPSTQAPVLEIIDGFSGIDRSTAGFFPPDVQMAVGPNHVFEAVNSQGRIWTKAGTQVDDFQLTPFFLTSGLGSPVDPKIMFDAISDRWFVSAFERNTGIVVLAVSTTNDPTGTFFIYHIPYPSSSTCPDQPKMGISNDKFVISTNDFTNKCFSPTSFTGGHLKLFDKSQLIAGSSLTIQDFPADFTRFAVTPAQSLSSTNTLYMVEEEFTAVTFYTISGTVPSATLSSQTFPILTAFSPPDGRQPGGTDFINTGGNRIQDAKWRQGNLWFSLNDSCVPAGDSISRSCVHLTQIDTTIPAVAQDFRISLNGFDFFYPAIAIDESDGLGVIFGFSSSAAFPSLAITSQHKSLSANTFGAISTVATGTEINEDGRYGDYFAGAVDPADPTILWAAGQYHILDGGFGSSNWSTWITSFTINDCTPPSSGTWNVAATCTMTATATAPEDVIVPNGVVLTIPNGITLNINFASFNLTVEFGGGVLIESGGKIT